MNGITNKLLELDPTLKIHNEGNWVGEYDPTVKGFTSFNDAGIECETGEFLYALVRLLKPQRVLETGTHWGIGASYMGLGLADNNEGFIDTIEFLPEIHQIANERFKRIGLSERIISHYGDAKNFEPPRSYQLILLDTEPITRFNELVKFYEHLDFGGYLFIHDAPRNLCQGNVNTDHPEMKSWPFGDIPDKMRELVNTDQLRAFHYPTPRGLVGFYKVHPDDVKWQ